MVDIMIWKTIYFFLLKWKEGNVTLWMEQIQQDND